jgi:hypothetical protein
VVSAFVREVSLKLIFDVPVFATGRLSVDFADPMVPLLKEPLFGFIAMGKVDLHAGIVKSKNAMEYNFFMVLYFNNTRLKTCL